MISKKNLNYIFLLIISFILSSNICYNLTYIITHDLYFSWDFNIIFSTLSVFRYIDLGIGTFLLTTIIFLFVLKYDRELKLRLKRNKKLPEEDGSFEYGSSRWMKNREIKKNFKVWNIGSKLTQGGIPALASDGWNPLHLPYKYFKEGNVDLAGDMIENFAKSLTKNLSSKDMYWEKSATAVLTALCYALIEDAKTEDEVNLFSLYNLLVEHGSKTIDRFNSLDLYFQQKPMGSLSKMAYATGSFAKGETRATLFSVLATTIKMFSDTGIASLTSRTDFELDTIGKNKMAVFLIIPDEKESRHELASLFVDQCYQSLINTAQSYSSGKMPIRVNFILDEFANMPPITSISNKITVSRSRNIRFYLVIQDFDQLKEKYKESAGTIKSNCTNWVYLLTADNETAKEISTRLGKYTISSDRVSTSTRLEQLDYNISNDKSLIGRELLMPDELMRFRFGEGLFLKTRNHPLKISIMPISKYPIEVKQVKLPDKPKQVEIKCFDLDKFRKEKTISNMNKVELE